MELCQQGGDPVPILYWVINQLIAPEKKTQPITYKKTESNFLAETKGPTNWAR